MAQITTDLEERLWAALKRIAAYQSVESLRRYAERDYGVSAGEAVEMAYENVLREAKVATRGIRRRKSLPPPEKEQPR